MEQTGVRSMGQALAESVQAISNKSQAVLHVLKPETETGRTIVSFSDAQAVVQEHQERKLGRKDAAKSKFKDKALLPTDQSFPGATINGSRENSAFWMLMEVRRRHAAAAPRRPHAPHNTLLPSASYPYRTTSGT